MGGDRRRAGRQGGGQDFGWNIMEGSHCYEPAEGCDQTGLTLPVAEYGHDLGCAVIGGVVVRDAATPTARRPLPVLATTASGNIWPIDPAATPDASRRVILESGRSISAIGQDADGVVYMTDLGGGELLRVEETGS